MKNSRPIFSTFIPSASDNPQTEILNNLPVAEVPLLDVEVKMNTANILQVEQQYFQDSNITIPHKDNNSPASEDQENNTNNTGCVGRAKKGLTNVVVWIGRRFFERIINNIADAAWDSIANCFDGEDNYCDEDE